MDEEIFGDETSKAMTNINEVVAAIHQGVREAVETQFDCKVTSIEAATETRYAPTGQAGHIYVMEAAEVFFYVDARQGPLEMHYKVAVDNNGVLRVMSTEMKLWRL